MKARDFRRIALALTGVVESSHMNHHDFRTGGRIFASLHADDRHAMVKLTPEQQKRFLADAPEVFTPENGAWGRQGCTRVWLESVDEDTLGEAVTLAWKNTTSKRTSRTTK